MSIESKGFPGIVKEKCIVWETEGEVVYLEPYGPDTVRLRASNNLQVDFSLNWTLLPPEPDQAYTEVVDDCAVLKNGKIMAAIRADGTVVFSKRDGTPLLHEDWQDKRVNMSVLRRAREYRPISSAAASVDVFFTPDPKEHFYGLGQDANDCLDLKGTVVELYQKNGKCTIPYVLSSKGYGFIWNNPAVGRVELARNGTRWHAEACKQIDYLVIAGDTPADINRRFTSITGRAKPLPEWAAGFWQSRLRYTSQEEVLQVAREYKRRNIPVSVMVIDYFHWTRQGEWKFDPQYWPDPKKMTEELESMGIKTMVSIWPTVDPRSENYEEMRKKNYLIKAERGLPTLFMVMGPQSIADFTHPDAQKFIWGKADKNYYSQGVQMFWLDEAEPEMRPYHYDNIRLYLGNGQEVSNLYPYYYAKAFYEGMVHAGATEVVNLIRCAWLGSQRLGIVLWSGDIPSTFDSLRRQIKAGLNTALCGIPWWTTDIGGFFGGDPDSEEFRELLVRWFQFGVFCPILRLHGKRLPYDGINKAVTFDAFLPSCGDNELWSFGEDVYRILKDLVNLRERLKPYIMQQMRLAAHDGTPVMRPLYYDYYQDERVYDLGDEYMFGPDLLVAPVVEFGARTREVYFPAGNDWRDVFTGEVFRGGQSSCVNAPLERIPVFSKCGGDGDQSFKI